MISRTIRLIPLLLIAFATLCLPARSDVGDDADFPTPVVAPLPAPEPLPPAALPPLTPPVIPEKDIPLTTPNLNLETDDPAAPIVFVIPSRFTFVKLAQDFIRLRPNRPLILIAYQKNPNKPREAFLHIWDPIARSWDPLAFQQFAAHAFSPTVPSEIILVGGDPDIPPGMMQAAAWCPAVSRLPELNIVLLVNAGNDRLRFTPAEWQYLAKEYNLVLKDLNETRRRYGKYGPPQK